MGLVARKPVRLLESIISRLTTNEISNFKLVSVAEQVGLNLAFSEPQKTLVFSGQGPNDFTC